MTINRLKGLNYFREILRFKKDPLESMLHLHQTYGELVYFGGPLKTLFLFSPEDIEHIFIKEKNNNEKGDQGKLLKVVLGEGLLVREKKEWRARRKQIQMTFHHQRYQNYQLIIKKMTEKRISLWKSGDEINLTKEISRLTFEIAGELYVGGISEDIGPRFNQAILNVGKILTGKLSSPIKLPFWIPSSDHMTLKRDKSFIDKVIYHLIEKRKKSGERGSSLLDSLLDHEDHLSDIEIRDEVVTFLVAGYETTASFVSWTLYILLTHQDILIKFQELEFGSDERKMILKEVLRLYPSVPLISRQATAEVEIRGNKITTGTNFVVSPYVIHRHPDYWTNFNDFNYQRFESLEENKHEFIPFSIGPKKCIGEELAYLEVETIVETLLTKVDCILLSENIKPLCKIALYMDKDFLVKIQRKK